MDNPRQDTPQSPSFGYISNSIPIIYSYTIHRYILSHRYPNINYPICVPLSKVRLCTHIWRMVVNPFSVRDLIYTHCKDSLFYLDG